MNRDNACVPNFVRKRTPALNAVAALTVCAFVITGCTTVDDKMAQPFSTVPTPTGSPESTVTPPPPTSTKPYVPPASCPEPSAAVIRGCLDTTSAIAALPDGQSLLVAELKTGNIMQVKQGDEPIILTNIPVNSEGDGGLLDIALSPFYSEDKLIFAYISTANENKVVRITPGDTPKDILKGIPHGRLGNSGGLVFTSPTQLAVVTGNIGNEQLSTDPNSLAGKLLIVDSPSPNQSNQPHILMSGIGTNSAVCHDPANDSLYVTDRTPTVDRLQRREGNGTVSTVWSWPERPGVTHCTALAGQVAVGLNFTKSVVNFQLSLDSGVVNSGPKDLVKDLYGHISGLTLGIDFKIYASTNNKSSGITGPFDDKAVVISGGFGEGEGNNDID
ncbi:MAG: PQQ-dependent sugar dehydrogenase [Mycobacteriaceae bacterium]